MLMAGVGLRTVLFFVLALVGLLRGDWVGGALLFGFALVQFVWPLLAVGANSLSVRLAPSARGESVGLFNAATALSAAVGSALAGAAFGAGGFATLTAAAFVGAGLAVILSWVWLKRAG